MKLLIRGVLILAGSVILLVASHLAFIEIGKEVVTLRTQGVDGTWQQTRLWIVDDGKASWLHSGGAAWRSRFARDPIVQVKRKGQTLSYRAQAVPGPHPRIDQLLHEKYGLADSWVRFISPDTEDTLAVRLEPLVPQTN